MNKNLSQLRNDVNACADYPLPVSRTSGTQGKDRTLSSLIYGPVASTPNPLVKASGRLGQALIRLMMRQVSVVAAERLAGRFKLITLEGEPLRGVTWIPGQKIQIAMGSAFVARTYTPIEWNASAGRTCILAFEPGHGPGSDWVRNIEPGGTCHLFGPRTSLDPRGMNSPVALFGDETSIGLAYALAQARPGQVTCVLEVDDVPATRKVLRDLELDHAEVIARHPEEAHLDAMKSKLPYLLAAGMSFILTGKSRTVQRLRQSLKAYGCPSTSLLAKAYWAPGKSGLD
ncbi:siderophore-interacting protein [Aurantiacibacter flavus]|uniref:Siderophore-interacting protein n=1 Tax=Aurantiacibacter flavus TaxID=3145232 RepID=A0ABV0D1H3_9SPHN